MLIRVLLSAAILVFFCGCSQVPTDASDNLPTFRSFFTGEQTYQAFYDRAGNVPTSTERLIGGIVPHHLLVGTSFARFYQTFASTQPSVVAVIGPNHFYAGRGPILTTSGRYQTPYGDLPINESIVHELVETGLALDDPQPFMREHSMSAEATFIRRTWPDALLVPIILKQSVTPRDAERLGDTLSRILPEDAVVLASVDFSHDLPERVADFHDQMSISALRSFDVQRVARLEVDSPASLIAVQSFLLRRGALRPLFQEHTNSASATGHPELQQTTSHVFMGFGAGAMVPEPALTSLFMGDVIFGRGVQARFAQEKTHMLDALAGMEDRFLFGSDVSMINLEGPITLAAPSSRGSVTFAFSPHVALPLVKRLRPTLAHVANNHFFDAGEQGMRDTLTVLDNLHIAPVGSTASPCAEQTAGGMRVAVCGFDDTNERLDQEQALKMLRSQTADRVVVSIHWGKEGRTTPTAHQRSLAQLFIDAGADAIIGHHPHVWQSIEVERGVPIIYSLGNLLFDQPDPRASSGVAAGVVFRSRDTLLYLFPLHTTSASPRHMDAHAAQEFFHSLRASLSSFEDPFIPGKYAIPRDAAS